MEKKEYTSFKMSKELNDKILLELARVKIAENVKDCQIAEKLGKTKQNYSTMVINGLSKLANIEAIADVLGYDIEVKFVKRG